MLVMEQQKVSRRCRSKGSRRYNTVHTNKIPLSRTLTWVRDILCLDSCGSSKLFTEFVSSDAASSTNCECNGEDIGSYPKALYYSNFSDNTFPHETWA